MEFPDTVRPDIPMVDESGLKIEEVPPGVPSLRSIAISGDAVSKKTAAPKPTRLEEPLPE